MSDIEFHLAVAIAFFCFGASICLWRGRGRGTLGLAVLAAATIFPIDYELRIRPVFHQWEQYHLFTTAKYFPELGYENFYVCAQAADQENEPSRWRQPQLIRDLKTNLLVESPPSASPSGEGRCSALFVPARWAEYKRDIAYFSKRTEELKPGRWLATFADHGVNVTPFWVGFYHPLVRAIPATVWSTTILSALDFGLLLAAVYLVYLGWGVDRVALVILFISLNEGSRPGWIVGSLFRFDWFFLLILGAYALKRGHSALALVATSFSVLFRPVVILAALSPLLRLMRTLSYRGLMMGGGSILAGATALLWISGTSLAQFAAVSIKYQNSFLTNSVGLLPPLIAPNQGALVDRGRELVADHSQAYVGLQPRQLNELLYREILTERFLVVRPYFWLAVTLILLLSAVSLFWLEALPAFVFAAIHSFLILSPPAYYSLVFVLLFLLPELPPFFIAGALIGLGVMKIAPLLFAQTALTYSLISLVLMAMVLPLNLWYLWSRKRV